MSPHFCRSHSKCMPARLWCVTALIQSFLDFWLGVRQQCWQGTNCQIQWLDSKLSTKGRKKITLHLWNLLKIGSVWDVWSIIHREYKKFSGRTSKWGEAYSLGGNVQHHVRLLFGSLESHAFNKKVFVSANGVFPLFKSVSRAIG